MVICLIGEPATGKTTLMKSIMSELGVLKFETNPFSHYHNKRFIVLGKYDKGVFQGTDKLSMAVQPVATDFVKANHDKIILFEGDRLGNLSFFKEVKKYHNLKIFCLKVDPNIKEVRHVVRADTQSLQFKLSKKTKVENILKAENCRVFVNNDYSGQALIKRAILTEFYLK